MKKIAVMTLLGTAILSSCTTYSEYMGTMTGANIGSIIGTGIGWTSHSRDGGLIGAVVGTAAGAAIGYGISKAAEESAQERYETQKRHEDEYNRRSTYDDTYGTTYDNNDYQTSGGASSDVYINEDNSIVSRANNNSDLTIINKSYLDSDGDGAMSKSELCNIIFEVKNNSKRDITDLNLNVAEMLNEKCFSISPSKTVKIKRGETLRYSVKVICKRVPAVHKGEFALTATSKYATANDLIRIRIKDNK